MLWNELTERRLSENSSTRPATHAVDRWEGGPPLFSLRNKRYGNTCPRFGVFPGLQSTRQGTNLTNISHTRNVSLNTWMNTISTAASVRVGRTVILLYRVKQTFLGFVIFLLHVSVRFTHLVWNPSGISQGACDAMLLIRISLANLHMKLRY